MKTKMELFSRLQPEEQALFVLPQLMEEHQSLAAVQPEDQ